MEGGEEKFTIFKDDIKAFSILPFYGVFLGGGMLVWMGSIKAEQYCRKKCYGYKAEIPHSIILVILWFFSPAIMNYFGLRDARYMSLRLVEMADNQPEIPHQQVRTKLASCLDD